MLEYAIRNKGKCGFGTCLFQLYIIYIHINYVHVEVSLYQVRV